MAMPMKLAVILWRSVKKDTNQKERLCQVGLHLQLVTSLMACFGGTHAVRATHPA